jgi:hypothetical protein
MRFRTAWVRSSCWSAAAAVTAVLLGASPQAQGASQVFPISATGAAEVTAGGVPNQGDPDGLAVGTITLDNGTGSGNTGSAIINVTLSGLDENTINLTGNHIHQAPATTTGSIVLDFGDPDAIRAGNQLSGTITGLSSATINNVFANPSGFYYNIHNAQFPGGAVRSQLTPEPGAITFLALGAGALIRRRCRR